VGEPATLAVVGLGQVDELEVETKRTRELVGNGKIESADAVERLLEMSGSGGCVCRSALRSFGLAAGDGCAAKGFDGVVKRVPGLFAENLAEKHAERADVAAKRSFL
jgi:tRNA-dihydrouridine synthase